MPLDQIKYLNNNFGQVSSLSPFSILSSSENNSPDDGKLRDILILFMSLPRNIKYKLTSSDISEKIRLIGQKHEVDLKRLENISRLINEYYFGEVRLEDFPKEIEKRMGVSLLTAQEIARYIQQEIIDWDPWGEYVATLPKMTIQEIVEKHPKIAEMAITNDYIEMRNSEDLEEPTIQNWIKDYVAHLGYAKHSQMQRTEYLFHSENGQGLSSPDREKLGIILKSFDENIPLPVDEENNEIIFDSPDEKPVFFSPPKQDSLVFSAPFPKPETAEIVTNEPRVTPTQKDFIKPYVPPSGTFRESPPVESPAPKPIEPTITKPVPLTPPAPKKNPDRPPNLRTDLEPPVKRATPIPAHQMISLHHETKAPASSNENGGIKKKPAQKKNPKIDELFSTADSPGMPPIKIHSITERRKSKAPSRENPSIPFQPPDEPKKEVRVEHRIINPYSFGQNEPKINGNIVDLSSI